MIAVTGMGIISAIGVGTEQTLASLLQGKSGIGQIKYLDTVHSDIPCAEVCYSDAGLKKMTDTDPEETATRAALLGIVAAREAIKSAGLHKRDGLRIAFINGTTVGGMEKSELYYPEFLSGNSYNKYIAAHECGACTEFIADNSGQFDYVTTMSTACSSAANAIIMAASLIREGIVDVAVAGGTECLTKFHLNGFLTLMILDNDHCRPFDKSRAGLNLGEGAAYLVLEKESTASDRNSSPICYLTGYGNACDAFHQTASSEDGKGARLAMADALEMSNLLPGDIGYINAHGTATPNNDISEGIAIQTLFGETIPPVSSTKGFTGHTTSAAGGVEAVISILSITNNFIPPNLNFREKMPELNFSPVDKITRKKIRNVMSNSFGFGGNNSSLIFSSSDIK